MQSRTKCRVIGHRLFAQPEDEPDNREKSLYIIELDCESVNKITIDFAKGLEHPITLNLSFLISGDKLDQYPIGHTFYASVGVLRSTPEPEKPTLRIV